MSENAGQSPARSSRPTPEDGTPPTPATPNARWEVATIPWEFAADSAAVLTDGWEPLQVIPGVEGDLLLMRRLLA